MNPSVFILLGRILLSIIFLFAAYGKLSDPAGTAGYLGSLGFPAPLPMAYVVGIFELLGGLAILVGFQTRIAAILLALFCVASALIAHADFADQNQLSHFLKNLGLAGGFLVLAGSGAGAYAIERGRAD